MNYLNRSLKQYLADVASVLPAPGGGSVSALTAGLGVSLLLMSANFSRKHFEVKGNARKLKELIKKLYSFKCALEELIDKDVIVFKGLKDAMSMPKEAKGRDSKLQKAFKNAAGAPLEICKSINNGIKYAEILSRHGNKHLMTDVGCGVILLDAGYRAARYNVLVNLKYIRDEKFVKRTVKDLGRIEKNIGVIKKKSLKYVDAFLNFR